ncbi:MAG TPA: PAS domain-containing methyl-accepting chemotaxis protein [Cellvibrio sp.]
MFFNGALKEQLAESQDRCVSLESLISAISSNVPVIEFSPEGTIIHANQLFLGAVGYTLNEVVGKHHRIFCEERYTNTDSYRQFWQKLKAGNTQQGTFLRLTKTHEPIWLEASYFPVYSQGKVIKILKIAKDISQQVKQSHDFEAIITALNKSLAVIEFTPDGKIITANDNFLQTMGYRLNDIVGQHHRLFCNDDFYRENPNFWSDLGNGRFQKGQFQRKHRTGKAVWLEATYNPIVVEGKIVKIIKFASDITAQIAHDQAVYDASQLAYTTSQETMKSAQDGELLLDRTADSSNNMSSEVAGSSSLIAKLLEESKQISAIVNTIRSIAEQTNLLALNAAIEAARAGENGRGFAVVADEVRNLAARTSSSTVEIEEVVRRNSSLTMQVMTSMESARQQAEDGNRLVQEAVAAIESIKAGATNVSHAVAKLAEYKKSI